MDSNAVPLNTRKASKIEIICQTEKLSVTYRSEAVFRVDPLTSVAVVAVARSNINEPRCA